MQCRYNRVVDRVEHIGEVLRGLRKKKGASQVTLAKASGVQQPVISNIESGKVYSLRPVDIARLELALGCKPGQLYMTYYNAAKELMY